MNNNHHHHHRLVVIKNTKLDLVKKIILFIFIELVIDRIELSNSNGSDIGNKSSSSVSSSSFLQQQTQQKQQLFLFNDLFEQSKKNSTIVVNYCNTKNTSGFSHINHYHHHHHQCRRRRGKLLPIVVGGNYSPNIINNNTNNNNNNNSRGIIFGKPSELVEPKFAIKHRYNKDDDRRELLVDIGVLVINFKLFFLFIHWYFIMLTVSKLYKIKYSITSGSSAALSSSSSLTTVYIYIY